jgi:hypothetical protein
MPPQIYDGSWRRPNKCGCHKVAYRDEAAALAAAELHGAEFDTQFRAYKCPGTTRWHLATRGFHPRALKSRPRILAWHISARGVISQEGLMHEVGLDPSANRASKAANRFFKTLKIFAELGLVKLDDPRPPYIKATDYDGLSRVMAVGLQEYAESRGVSITKPPGSNAVTSRVEHAARSIGTPEEAAAVYYQHVHQASDDRLGYIEPCNSGEDRTVYRVGDVVYKVPRSRLTANLYDHRTQEEARRRGYRWAPPASTLWKVHDGVWDQDVDVLAMPYLEDDGSAPDPVLLAEMQAQTGLNKHGIAVDSSNYVVIGGQPIVLDFSTVVLDYDVTT